MRAVSRSLRDRQRALEDAGAAGIVTSLWSGGWGVNKVFSAGTRLVPAIDVSCEDYGMLFRMVEAGQELIDQRLVLDDQLPLALALGGMAEWIERGAAQALEPGEPAEGGEGVLAAPAELHLWHHPGDDRPRDGAGGDGADSAK